LQGKTAYIRVFLENVEARSTLNFYGCGCYYICQPSSKLVSDIEYHIKHTLVQYQNKLLDTRTSRWAKHWYKLHNSQLSNFQLQDPPTESKSLATTVNQTFSY